MHPGGQADLYVLRHNLLRSGHRASALLLAHHALNTLDTTVAVMEALGDILRHALNVLLLGALRLLVVEAWQHMLLMQALQLLRLARNVGQDVCDLVGDVGPPRRQQVHLDHGVAIVVVVGRSGGQQAAPVVVCIKEHRGAGGGAKALGRAVGAGIFVAVCGMVGVGLSVGEVAGEVRGLEKGAVSVAWLGSWHTGLFGLATWRTSGTEGTRASMWPLGSSVVQGRRGGCVGDCVALARV